MRNIIAIFLCALLITSCVSRKKKARHFDYKNFGNAFAKVNDSLFASTTEVSNQQYATFLNYLKNTDTIKYNAYNIDSTSWNKILSYGDPYIKNYHSHPAYIDYPVVNISYEGAVAFCQWLTNYYNNEPKRGYKKVVFRLPTEEEWKVAARGGRGNTYFPWGGPFMQNSKGSYLANFRFTDECNAKDTIINDRELVIISSGEAPGIMGNLGNYGFITTPINSYFPNNLGLYNMAGNVSEMLNVKGRTKGGNWSSYGYYLRIDAPDEFGEKMFEPSPLVGFRVFVEVIEE